MRLSNVQTFLMEFFNNLPVEAIKVDVLGQKIDPGGELGHAQVITAAFCNNVGV